ncbi:MAG TPA: ADP-ribosylglycohydrolase family protein [bacterium]|nr:ADP-ribosylglycohydrolase family protein [Candidatus Omnitrophota bacterium]HOJ61561.1 ADP-ribosylglycohydrolase family protein [bacterium]HOL92856.1 ADP-ribosylglycohydrolase family protein [bacterium]HPP01230.1 ADP-ribosylglycohydrolase family protein [bacterium]HXK92765.1 ADP-ribosylglycohydrolase family protein [bacterium]
MRPQGSFVLVVVLALMFGACATGKKVTDSVKKIFRDDKPEKLETRRLSIFEYEDILLGAWAGKMIGASVGAPYTNRFYGQVMEEPMRSWRPELVENALVQDDLCVPMTFLQALEEKGLSLTSAEAADYFGRIAWPLTHAHDAARRNIRAGIPPPDSGHPRYNPHANDLSFQTGADLFGLLCPGMPFTAIRLAETFGPMMSYGDGLYGGLFVAGMYAAAFFENDRAALIEQGLKGIPADSSYARLIRDVLEFYRTEPAQWRGCWQMLEDKWAQTDLCPQGYNKPFNIDAKLNGGYVVLGLLYGEGEFPKTLEITTRCGQQTGSNTATAAGLLGAMLGYSRIPRPFKMGIPVISERPFQHTKYTFTTLTQTCKKMTEMIIRRYGGDVQRLGDREYYSVPVQSPPPPPPLEQFTESQLAGYQNEWSRLDQIQPD